MTHVPAPETRRQVETMCGYGVPEFDIARVIGIDGKTLRKHYRDELDLGLVKANANVARTLYARATDLAGGHGSITAAIFWLKCRAGWREASVLDVPRTPREDEIGKKELAQLQSNAAGDGNEWGDLVLN